MRRRTIFIPHQLAHWQSLWVATGHSLAAATWVPIGWPCR